MRTFIDCMNCAYMKDIFRLLQDYKEYFARQKMKIFPEYRCGLPSIPFCDTTNPIMDVKKAVAPVLSLSLSLSLVR